MFELVRSFCRFVHIKKSIFSRLFQRARGNWNNYNEASAYLLQMSLREHFRVHGNLALVSKLLLQLFGEERNFFLSGPVDCILLVLRIVPFFAKLDFFKG